MKINDAQLYNVTKGSNCVIFHFRKKENDTDVMLVAISIANFEKWFSNNPQIPKQPVLEEGVGTGLSETELQPDGVLSDVSPNKLKLEI